MYNISPYAHACSVQHDCGNRNVGNGHEMMTVERKIKINEPCREFSTTGNTTTLDFDG